MASNPIILRYHLATLCIKGLTTTSRLLPRSSACVTAETTASIPTKYHPRPSIHRGLRSGAKSVIYHCLDTNVVVLEKQVLIVI